MHKIILPIDLVLMDQNSYHIFLHCIINHNDCEMLIDTGASRSVFDIFYLTEPLPSINSEEIITAAVGPGNLNTQTGMLELFSIDNHTWRRVPAMFMDLSHINQIYARINNKKIAGLLGSDILYQTNAIINYGKKNIRLSIPARYTPKF
jgi:hypothetical protein